MGGTAPLSNKVGGTGPFYRAEVTKPRGNIGGTTPSGPFCCKNIRRNACFLNPFAGNGVEQHPCRTLGPKMMFYRHALQWWHAHQNDFFFRAFGSSASGMPHANSFFADYRFLILEPKHPRKGGGQKVGYTESVLTRLNMAFFDDVFAIMGQLWLNPCLEQACCAGLGSRPAVQAWGSCRATPHKHYTFSSWGLWCRPL